MKVTREELACKIIDAHTHSGGISFTHYFLEAFPYCCSIRELILNMNNAMVDYSITFPIPTNICTAISPTVDKITHDIIFTHEPCLYYWANRRLLIETRMYGEGRVLPFVLFSLYGDYKRQIENINILSKEFDIYGIKIHTSADRTSLERILEEPILFSFFQNIDLPIIVHSGFERFSNAAEMCKVFEAFPNLRFCVAHAGRMNSKFLHDIKDLSNVWIDISPITHLYETLNDRKEDIIQLDYSNPQEMINYLMEKFSHKVLFGTDYPWVHCGYLKKFKNTSMPDDYLKSIEILKSFPDDYVRKLSNNNVCDLLFGV